MKNSTRITIYSTLSLIALLTVIAGIDFYRTFVQENIAPGNPSEGVVKIDRTADYEQTCDIIVRSGVLKNPRTFLRCARAFNLRVKFRPGYYVFTPGMNNRDIVRTLAYGLQKPVNLVLGENAKTLEQLASGISLQIDCDSLSLISAFRDSSVISQYGFAAETFPGMFIPNTYEVYWTITPSSLLTRLYREYENFWKNGRDEKAAAMGFSRNDVSTLASIVAEETNCLDEMPVVAGVYINRLHRNMPLQADPTVKFAVGNPSLGRILNIHLQTDSPYNTYLYPGLPPGPISIPHASAIDAVLNYSRHDYIFFCAKASFDGRHSFASTLSQHQANARRYHAALDSLRAAKRKAKALADAAEAASTSSQEGRCQESSSPSQEPKQ